MQYLQEEKYYVDIYDLHTIEQCLEWYWDIKNKFEEHRKDKDFKDYNQDKFNTEVHKITSYSVNIISIQRYRRKAETIKEWMDRDRKMQDKFDNAIPPDEIFCKECFSRTKITSKDLLVLHDEDSQVMFMFECVKCKKRQTLYEDGTEWVYEPPKCPECNTYLDSDSKHTKDTLVTIYSCSKCSYEKKDVHDFKKSDEKRKKEAVREKELLAKYRKDFCLDDVEGPKAVQSLDTMMKLADEFKEKEKNDKDPDYQKARQLKSLKVGQLKELIEKTIENEGYKDLAFSKPDMGQYVVIDFSVNDMKEDRKEYYSQNTLKKLIKAVLEDTNWRLMSEGIQYRLGILTGRLKAFEREEDLVKLVSV